MKQLTAKVKNNVLIAENIYAMTLTLPESVGEIKCGQFLNVSVGDSSHLLKRPFGVMKVEGDDVTFCYQIKGEGTKILSETQSGTSLSVLLPLGNGFDLKDAENVVVIGGGVGIFPLISVIRQYKDVNFYSYIGFRNKSAVCLLDELEKSTSLKIVTDDGSYGEKGNAVSAYLKDYKNVRADVIVACGPPVMLKVLKQTLEEKSIDIKCLVSLEERMGCGIGACLVCTCKKSNGDNARVCKDGPVFDIREVEL